MGKLRQTTAEIQALLDKVEQVDLGNYYTKKETDDLIADIEVSVGGEGLKYSVERTAYPTKYIIEGHEDNFEISEEERQYNIETFNKSWNDSNVILSFAGGFVNHTLASQDATTGEGYVVFNVVQDFGDVDFPTGLISQTATIYSNGDATIEIKQIQTGSAPTTKSDFNRDFINDF